MTAAVRTELTLVVGLALLGITQQRRRPPWTGQHARPVLFPRLSLITDPALLAIRPFVRHPLVVLILTALALTVRGPA